MIRARVEMVLSVIFAVLTIVTLIWPTWIEAVSGFEPDGGSGELEWLIVAAFASIAIVVTALARRDYRAANRRLARGSGPDEA
jgi:hypothetical protein